MANQLPIFSDRFYRVTRQDDKVIEEPVPGTNMAYYSAWARASPPPPPQPMETTAHTFLSIASPQPVDVAKKQAAEAAAAAAAAADKAKCLNPVIIVANPADHRKITIKWAEAKHYPNNVGYVVRGDQLVVCIDTNHGYFEHSFDIPADALAQDKFEVTYKDGEAVVVIPRRHWVRWLV
ncbi:hypothetical protein H4R34_003477 [Dimargaris verticillata]|uniref:Uncharacterized protein n=1 Tax=Dimargaris verticillata TaxID=2761393 RepID=A0A9W8B0M2_9FUNG|nr:hypothetical protein H4R34_003477 [Dimargaris verticillata]